MLVSVLDCILHTRAVSFERLLEPSILSRMGFLRFVLLGRPVKPAGLPPWKAEINLLCWDTCSV